MGVTRRPIDISADAVRDALAPWGLTGWNVRKAPLVALDASGTTSVHALAAVIRDDPRQGAICLGVIGNHNHPIQNEDQAELLMRILEVSRLDLLDAGYIGEGHQVFLVCDVPGDAVLESDELGTPPLRGPFELVTLNHHDGSGALWFYVLPAGTWATTLRPLFAPLAVRQSGTGWIARHALTKAHLRHNASRRGIAGKLRHDLRLDRAGGRTLAVHP